MAFSYLRNKCNYLALLILIDQSNNQNEDHVCNYFRFICKNENPRRLIQAHCIVGYSILCSVRCSIQHILANVTVMVFCAHNTYSIYTTNKNKNSTPFQTLENQLHKTVLPCQAIGQIGHHKSHDWCHARHRYSVRNSSSPAARCPRREEERGSNRKSPTVYAFP